MIIDFEIVNDAKVCYFCKKNKSNISCYYINIVSENRKRCAVCRYCLRKNLSDEEIDLLAKISDLHKIEKKNTYIDQSLKKLVGLHPNKKIYKILSIHRVIYRSESVDTIYKLVKRYEQHNRLNKKLSRYTTSIVKRMINDFVAFDRTINTEKVYGLYFGPGSTRLFENKQNFMH